MDNLKLVPEGQTRGAGDSLVTRLPLRLRLRIISPTGHVKNKWTRDTLVRYRVPVRGTVQRACVATLLVLYS